jgi:hypothetical protein
LEKVIKSGGRAVFKEGKKWVRARRLLDKATESGERLPVIFAPAEATGRLFACALIEEVIVEDDGPGARSTSYRFSGLTRVGGRRRKCDLVKASNGERLSES